MLKIAIGISVYNNSNNVKNLIHSILAQTQFTDYEIVVCDDGSMAEVSDEVSRFCHSLGIPLIKNSENCGVPYSWNRLTNYFDCQYMVILNDDTRVIYPRWLSDIAFFLDKNSKVGIVDWRENIIAADGKFLKSTTSHHEDSPGIKLKPSGPFFAFRKEIWQQIQQPDASIGFWEDLLSYGEEKDIAAEFATRGLCTVQLPFYMEHFKSQTFNNNPQARLRKTYSPFLSEEEFFGEYYSYSQLGRIRQSSHHQKFAGFASLKSQLKTFLMGSKRTEQHQPTRIEYSRAMFAKSGKTGICSEQMVWNILLKNHLKRNF
jgi:glycosyltransferase involved in cell wall biosynthesis